MGSEFFDDDRPRKRRRRRRDPDRPRRRKGGWWFWFLVLIVAAVAFLPVIVAKTPLRDVVISWLVPGDGLRFAVGDASLGWFTTPAVSNVDVRDAAGRTLVKAEAVRINRTPWMLTNSPRDLGTIEIVRPTVFLTVRPDGSNLEDVVAQFTSGVDPDNLAGAEDRAKPQAVAFSIRLIDGTILAEDVAIGRRWRIEGVNLEYDSTVGGRISVTGRVISEVAGEMMPPGGFAVSLTPVAPSRQQLTCQVTAVPMMLADPWLRRFVKGVEANGTLSGEGTATWTTSPSQFPSDLATSGTLRIERLDATAPALLGDRVRLERVELPWRLSAQPGGLTIDTLELRSEVGQVAMRGTVDGAAFKSSWLDSTAKHDVEVRGSLDLARLAAMLPRALRIREGTTITSGAVDLAARCQPIDGGQTISGSLRTAQLAATSAGRPLRWDQPLAASFALRREAAMVRFDALQCESEFLKIGASGTPQDAAVHAQFDLNRLVSQLGQFVDFTGIELAGQGELTTNLRANETEVAAEDAKVSMTNLRVVAPGWKIDEPRVEFSGGGRWNGATRQLTADSAQLVTSTVSLAVKDVRFQAGERGIAQMNGQAAFRVDLARWAAWQAAAEQTPRWQPRGMISGNLRFDQQADRVVCELTAEGENIALAEWRNMPTASVGMAPTGYQVVWQEPQLAVRGRATYERAADRLAVDELQVQSNTLQATAGGQIERLSTTADANLTGTVQYDLAQVTPLLRPYVGDGVQLAGREMARVQIAGQLAKTQAAMHWSRRLQARVEAPWTSASLYGLPVGAGKIVAAFGDGVVRVDPLSLAVAEGRLTAAPLVRLDPEPMELTLPGGPVISQVRITPEVSEAMLKYVAPVLAGITQSEGLFSMNVDGLRLPLAEPRRCDAAGQLTVHWVRVAPGPLASQWIDLAQQIEAIAKNRDPLALVQRQPATLLSIQDQTVTFRVADGRVYHQDMQFQIGDVTLHSQGSVGFDETLSLVLRVPIQDRWIEGRDLLVGLKGQSLSVPITGTLRSPQMDRNAVAELSRQLLQSAVGQGIGDELNKALDRLFKSR